MAEDKGRKKFVRGGLLPRALDLVERWGNSLPHPFSLFVLFSLGVLVLSWIASSLELSAIHPATGKKIAVVNLLDRQGIQNIIAKAVTNFTGFAPLGTVLVAMIGVGVAERSGLFSAALKALVAGVPSWLMTAALVFAGVNASIAVDAGYVILIPLGVVLFAGIGRHPIVGLAAAFAQKYEPKMGLGTLLAMMLPYSIAFAISWIVLLALWLLFGIPLGPGASLTYPPLP